MTDMAVLLKRISSVTAAIAVVAGILSPLGAFPVFQTGYWNLVDSSFVVILMSGILAIASLAMRGLVDPWWRDGIPMSAIFLAVIAGLGGLTALWADMPWVALIGTYQSAYGPVWHLLAASMLVVVWTLKDNAAAISIFSAVATVTALTVSGVLLYSQITATTVFIPGGDSYGLIGFLLLFFPDDGRGKGRIAALQFYSLRASAVLLIVLSSNLSLVAIVCAGALLAGAFWAVSRRRPELSTMLERIPAWLVAALVIVSAGAVLALIVGDAVDVKSMRMRAIIANIMGGALQDSSLLEWIFGHGWGHTQAAFFQYLHWGNMVLYTKEWDFLWREMFHSHNFLIETQYSIGAVGVFGMLALITSIYVGAPQHRRTVALAFVVGYVLYSSVWFELSFHMPFFALALASFAPSRARSGPREGKGQGQAPSFTTGTVWATGMSVGAIAVLGMLAASYYSFSINVYPLKADKGSIENERFMAKYVPPDPRRTDLVRRMLYVEAMGYIEIHKELQNAQGLAVLKDVLEDVNQRMATTQEPGLVMVGLNLFGDIALLPEWAWTASVVDGKAQLWEKLAERSLDLAPYRSDILISYLTHLLAEKRYDSLETVVSRILSKKPDDPVAMYYLGAMLTQAQDMDEKRTGLSWIANAMDCGVDRFMEIPEWLANTVQPYRNLQTGCKSAMKVGKN
ncbi:hypothetical protein [Magnetovibrio sp.]|uniref:hypothetical protein n=1 Tax=Magnetovibrio sp. TaxID=2024836 RepID=UPI002F93CBF8